MDVRTEQLAVQLSAHTMQLLRQEAQRRAISEAELVRQAIELLLAQDREARVQAAQALFQVEAPIADWDKLKQEIEEAHQEVELP